jgi:hypothetical protein
MTSEPVIPEKIKISVIFELLGLSHMSEAARFDGLISLSQDSGLLFTFKSAARGIPIGDSYDGNSELTPTSSKDIQCIFRPKSFILNNYSIDKGKAFTSINHFKESDLVFHIINKDKSDFGAIKIDLADVYVKKSDYNNFIMELKSPSPEIKPLYMDINSEYYAQELDLAIQLFHAIQIEKFGNVNQSINRRVSSWLVKNKPDKSVSEAQTKRLSAIIRIVKKNRLTL